MLKDKLSEFKRIREKLDLKINSIAKLIKTMDFQDAEQELQEVNELYEYLESIATVASSIHHTTLENRAFSIQNIEIQIQSGLARREAGKREDGNIAFKCNWNDAGYKGICSDQVYNINKLTAKSQCSRSNCREYVGKTPPKIGCCYEHKSLIEIAFGAGWDHDDYGRALRPRHIWSAKKGKVALLTTIPHGTTERVIAGAYLIIDVKDDQTRETFIYGDKNTVLDDMLVFSIPFWRYHKNPLKPESQAWGQGLFRYVSDVAVLGILEAYRKGKIDRNGDISRVDKIIKVIKEQHPFRLS
ncbi:MAG: hypothetical protein PHW73_03975 [Atribacterota bacterium]|nr:hypothetical protein [Atribacterota bacterium]